MSARRRRKVGTIIRDEVSAVIQQELKDPRLGFISVTRVDMSPDLHYARVFVSVFGGDEDQQQAMNALESASGYVRHLLAPRLSLRTVPVISFVLDNNMQHAEHINRLLDELTREATQAIVAESGKEERES